MIYIDNMCRNRESNLVVVRQPQIGPLPPPTAFDSKLIREVCLCKTRLDVDARYTVAMILDFAFCARGRLVPLLLHLEKCPPDLNLHQRLDVYHDRTHFMVWRSNLYTLCNCLPITHWKVPLLWDSQSRIDNEELCAQTVRSALSRSGTRTVEHVIGGICKTHRLNGKQRVVLHEQMKYRCCPIRGPPGTGKSVTAVVLTDLSHKCCTVLGCAPSHAGIDSVMCKFIGMSEDTSKFIRAGRLGKTPNALRSYSITALCLREGCPVKPQSMKT